MRRHPKAPGNYWDGYMAGMLRVIRQPMPPSWYGDRSLALRGCNDWIARTANPADPGFPLAWPAMCDSGYSAPRPSTCTAAGDTGD